MMSFTRGRLADCCEKVTNRGRGSSMLAEIAVCEINRQPAQGSPEGLTVHSRQVG